MNASWILSEKEADSQTVPGARGISERETRTVWKGPKENVYIRDDGDMRPAV